MWKIIFGILSVVSLFWGTDCSGGTKIHVNHVWAQLTPQEATPAAVYFTVTNDTDEPDTLLALSSDDSNKIEMKETVPTTGTPVTNIIGKRVIKPGQTLVFAPNGVHGALSNLKQDLIEGETMPLHLVFEKAGIIKTEALIESPTDTQYRRASNAGY